MRQPPDTPSRPAPETVISRPALSPDIAAEIVDLLGLAIFVFGAGRSVYSNQAAEFLRSRLRGVYRIEIDVVLADQIRAWLESGAFVAADRPLLAQITAPDGQPFYLQAMPLERHQLVAVSVRMTGSQIDAIRARFGLSARESEVAELVIHGYRNGDVAVALGVAPATVKKHLTRIFDKVGVDSRTQLLTRLG